MSKEEVLKMKIDAEKVTCDDLDHYEKLMQGSITMAASNSNNKVGPALDKNN
jgi:hypothetical protein